MAARPRAYFQRNNRLTSEQAVLLLKSLGLQCTDESALSSEFDAEPEFHVRPSIPNVMEAATATKTTTAESPRPVIERARTAPRVRPTLFESQRAATDRHTPVSLKPSPPREIPRSRTNRFARTLHTLHTNTARRWVASHSTEHDEQKEPLDELNAVQSALGYDHRIENRYETLPTQTFRPMPPPPGQQAPPTPSETAPKSHIEYQSDDRRRRNSHIEWLRARRQHIQTAAVSAESEPLQLAQQPTFSTSFDVQVHQEQDRLHRERDVQVRNFAGPGLTARELQREQRRIHDHLAQQMAYHQSLLARNEV